MTTIQIFALILSSSVIAAGLTSLVNWYLQKDNYKNDYYKKILDKRLDAYNTVEQIIGQLKVIVRLESGHLCPVICSMGKTNFDQFIVGIVAGSYKSFWLSDEISGKLTEINVYLLQEIDNKINENLNPKEQDKQIMQLGVQHRDKIQTFRNELAEMLYKDFSGLHNIKKFIKSSRLQNTFSIRQKEKQLQKLIDDLE